MYNKILVPLDGSELAECVLPHVESIAKGCHTKNIIFIRVVEPVVLPVADGEYFSSNVWTQIESQEKATAVNYLNDIVNRVQYEGINVEAKVILGRVAESVVDFATKNEIDLIIIATHGRSGVNRWLRGSVANRVLHAIRSPILIIPPPEQFEK
ncbi:MAG: universal stress protein [Dehalococcoidia bacterium]